jgi:hypothetical protein
VLTLRFENWNSRVKRLRRPESCEREQFRIPELVELGIAQESSEMEFGSAADAHPAYLLVETAAL